MLLTGILSRNVSRLAIGLEIVQQQLRAMTHGFDTQHGQSSDSKLSADIGALIKTLSDVYSQGKFFPNMSHIQNAQNTPIHLHIRDMVNFHNITIEITMKIPIEVQMHFSNIRTSLLYNRLNPCNRTGGHRNFRSSNHTMVHEMSQGRNLLKSAIAMNVQRPLEEEGPLGSPESPSSEDPKN